MASSAKSRLGSSGGDGGHGKDGSAWPPFMARYEPLEKVGSGANGVVYKAWDTKEKQIVAVKQLSGSSTGLREFGRETMNLAACRGVPSIVQLRATLADYRSDGDAFIVTDYVGPGINLRYFMELRCRLNGPFSEAEVRGIMLRLMEIVKDVHDAGVLHRDIRPENVLLDDGGGMEEEEEETQKPMMTKGTAIVPVDGLGLTFRLCDLGQSCRTNYQTEEITTMNVYTAPELLLGTRRHDERVDTWGLGCIMAELFFGTGVPVFEGPSLVDILRSVFRVVGMPGFKRPCLHKRLFPRRPAALSSAALEVLSGLLERNPEKRLTVADALQKPWFNAKRHCGFGGCLV